MHPIIKLENISKRYTLGTGDSAAYGSLREMVMTTARAQFERLVRNRERRTEETLWALRDLNLEIYPGERLGIVGRNGAGKSTLLRILSRITEPTSGRVELYGRVGSLLEVGTGFHPELTGRENIFLNGAILGMRRSEIERKFDEIVAFAEIERFLDTPVKRYSSGMYTRLAFAVAAHLEPEILIVDEVLAVGDAAFQKKCLGKMGEVAREGRTVLFVSHNLAAVRSLCSRAIWLDSGHVVGQGETGQVVLEYLQKGTLSTLEQVWADPATAPGNEKVKIRRARLRPLAPHDCDEISVESALQIEFEFWIYQPEIVLNFTMHLFTIEGTYVFAAPSEAKPRQRGLVTATVKIPSNFLNDGIYTVTIQVVQDTASTLYMHPDILVFEVLDSVREGNWFGKWPGVVRPRLEWISESVVEGSVHEYK